MILMIASLNVFGCAARKVDVPGCNGRIAVDIPQDCYSQNVEDGIEIRCSDGSKFVVHRCKVTGTFVTPKR